MYTSLLGVINPVGLILHIHFWKAGAGQDETKAIGPHSRERGAQYRHGFRYVKQGICGFY